MAPKSWPIFRKGTKYVVRPSIDVNRGVPILVVLRDLLKIVQNRKEAKRAIHMKQILLNNKPVNDEKTGVLLFDTITLVPSKKNYRLKLSKNKKVELEEIAEKDSNYKVAKVVGKKVLKKKRIQLNLNDGKNFISDVKCNINDSVLINFKDKKIEKCLPFTENSRIFVFAGKHAGEEGLVKKIDIENKIVQLDIKGKPLNALIKQLIVVNKNE